MISRFHVQNYKCLRDVTIDFAPFTVLIGPNDSGKSSVLQAIHELTPFLSAVRTQSVEHRRLVNVDPRWNERVWRRQRDLEIRWQVTESTTGTVVQAVIPGTGRPTFPASGETFAQVVLPEPTAEDSKSGSLVPRSRLQTVPRKIAARLETRPPYKFHPDAMRKRVPVSPAPTLQADGSNLAAVMDAMLTGPDRASLLELEQKLYQLFPTLRGISAPTVSEQRGDHKEMRKALQFVLSGSERPPVAIPAELVSDGALLVTAYLALAYGDTPEILLIEEPENGLHPSRLGLIVGLLRQLTSGEIGLRKRQIILATQSPLFLNLCQPDEVRIVTRDAEGATQVTPLSATPNLPSLLSEFGIGELWYLLGEEGLLAGRTP
jgi:energy-coupling factor transporter ATP-binding protein EcfA2